MGPHLRWGLTSRGQAESARASESHPWAIGEGTSEDAAADYQLTVDGPVDIHLWDYSQTGVVSQAQPQPDVVTLSLTGAPQIIIESGS